MGKWKVWGIIMTVLIVPVIAFGKKPQNGEIPFSDSIMEISFLNLPGYPLGMKNNNPLNLIATATNWQGEIPTTGNFAQFKSYVWGVRAAIKNMISYINTHGRNTIVKIIECWAPRFNSRCPGSEGSTGDNSDIAVDNYIKSVESATGINRNATITASYNFLSKLIPAMAMVETGRINHGVTPEMFAAAWSLI